MDVLADVLAVTGVRGTLGARIDAGEDWGWWVAEKPGAAIHAVTAGTAWLGRPGESPVQLLPGDVVLLPGGAEHVIASDPDALARTNERVFDDWEPVGEGVVRIGTGPVGTHVLCAHYDHDPAAETKVLELLPELLHLRSGQADGGLEDTLRLLGRELAHPQIATTAVLDSLVDVLLVQVMRAWLAGEPADAARCWLRVLGDPVVGTALKRLHDDPARPWTTEALAREVAVSRATLARRFPQLVGETPAAYLTRWRMDLAARRLRDTDDPLEAVAQAVGYTSVYAFSRAFSRARAQPPGRYRSASRAARGRR
jgi:AraC-like DNA-binding protein